MPDPGGAPMAAADDAERRRVVLELLRSGEVRGPRDLRRRLGEQGYAIDDAQLRADLSAVGAVRVEGPRGARLGLPADESVAASSASSASARVDAPRAAASRRAEAAEPDPDWRLHLVVVAVVVAFLVVGLLGWLIGGSGGSPPTSRQPGVTSPASP
ncbi:MAG: hypothetical protein JWN46_1299 [Acidimicrobiales bacterium]|nr:hypothetical protein [Acidimicrobiales bacterium]